METSSRPATPNFQSVFAKLRRAEEHFEAVDAEIDEWLKAGSHVYTPERDPDFTYWRFVVRMKGPDPHFERWTLIVGDFIQNLRSCLDHLVFAIARFQNGEAAPIEGSSFVIADNVTDFRKWARSRLRHLSPAVVAAIEEVQPFCRTNPNIPPVLAILRDLSNADKHKMIRLAVACITAFDLEFSGKEDRTIERNLHINPGQIEDGGPVLALFSSKPEPNMTFEGGTMGLSVALWHGARDDKSDALSERTHYKPLLTMIVEEVKHIIATVSAVSFD